MIAISDLCAILYRGFSGDAAKRYVAEISRHHRIQASPGYRAAAHWLLDALQSHGIAAAIESFPADETSRFWVQPSFQEWECRAATLDWLHGNGRSERLCDFRAVALAVVQRSAAVADEFAVVDVGDGRAEDYVGRDVAGKLVLSRSPVRTTYQHAVIERGAAGVLFDHIDATTPGRSRVDLPDARQYSSFWWQPGQRKSWGFVLTPRQGDALRKALARGQEVRLRAHIDSRFYDGAFEVVTAVLPGTDPAAGAMLGMAHLCHPQGFANDNASGAACLLETVITLHRLIETGLLPRPRRTLHFLWIPEMTGTYAWLSRHEELIPSLIAGINLDMVGEDQNKTGSVQVIERPPAALPSFASDLLERLREEMLHGQSTLGGTSDFPLFRFTTTPFSGGSDHIITSDPTVGVPTPMIIQWPDRFYHTTADTLDTVDPVTLLRSGALTGSYLYWLAAAELADAQWLGWEMVSRYERGLSQRTQDEVTQLLSQDAGMQDWQQLDQLLQFSAERVHAALSMLGRLGVDAATLAACTTETEEITRRLRSRAHRQVQPDRLPATAMAPDAWAAAAAPRIPQRLYRGPIMDLSSPICPFPLPPEADAAWQRLFDDVPNWRSMRLHAEYWVDGQRSLAEIARCVELETGRAIGPAIEAYFDLLALLGFIRWETPAGSSAAE